MEEKTYLHEGKILVTTNRIEIDGQTFAVRNIGSVKVTKESTPRTPLIVILLGVGMLVHPTAWPLGVLLIGAGAYWVWKKSKERTLVLVSGGGEQVAMKAENGALVERIRNAIAQAISAR